MYIKDTKQIIPKKRRTEKWQLRVRPDDLVEHQIHRRVPILFFPLGLFLRFPHFSLSLSNSGRDSGSAQCQLEAGKTHRNRREVYPFFRGNNSVENKRIACSAPSSDSDAAPAPAPLDPFFAAAVE